MALTLTDLLNFESGDYTQSVSSWDRWAEAVRGGRSDLDQAVIDLSANWKGMASTAASERISGESSALGVSYGTLQSIASKLESAAGTLAGYKSQAEGLVGEIKGDPYLSLDVSTGAVTVNASAVSGSKSGGYRNGSSPGARAGYYTQKLQGILSEVRRLDQGIAGEIDGLMPPVGTDTDYTPTEPAGYSGGSSSDGASGGTPVSSAPIGGANTAPAASGDVAGYQAYAKNLLATKYGYSGQDLDHQFQCLVNLWNRESGWNPTARNPGSGAYGIVQALPPTKMATFGSDWATNWQVQIQWGLDYIHTRPDYGSPCAAWSHELSAGWY